MSARTSIPKTCYRCGEPPGPSSKACAGIAHIITLGNRRTVVHAAGQPTRIFGPFYGCGSPYGSGFKAQTAALSYIAGMEGTDVGWRADATTYRRDEEYIHHDLVPFMPAAEAASGGGA